MVVSEVLLSLALLCQAGAEAGQSSLGPSLQFGPLQAAGATDLQTAPVAGQPALDGRSPPTTFDSNPPGAAVAGSDTDASDAAKSRSASPSAYPSRFDEPLTGTADSRPSLTGQQRMAEPATTRVASAAPLGDSAAPALLREALTDLGRLRIDGHGIDLKTLLGRHTGTARLAAVRAYWQLTRTLAAYRWATDEQQFLSAIPAPDAGQDALWLSASQATADAERAAAHLAVVRAQQALAEYVPSADRRQLSLPTDVPFVGVYRTHFKELNERGAAANELQQIDHSLPLIHNVIEAQAAASTAAAAALPGALQAYQRGDAPLAHVLEAHERLRGHRRAFLTAVEQYNSAIAGYAMSVSVPVVSVEQIAGMLIETRPGGKSVLTGGRADGVQRASHNEPVREESDGPRFRAPRLDGP